MKNNINKITLEDLSKIYSNMNYLTNIITVNNKRYLELLDKYQEGIYLIYLHTENYRLTIDDVKEIIIDMDITVSEFKKYSNYMIISIAGYKNESKFIKEDNLDIYNIEQLSTRLEDSSYIEELINLNETNTQDNYIDLLSHNKVAYDSVKKYLLENKKACISHPTGTGKTVLISRIIKDFKDKKVLVLSSSRYILNYFKTTNSICGKNIKLMTYKKLSLLEEDEFESLINDEISLIILDEYHRCGAKTWNKSVSRLIELSPNAYILGTSATSIRYLDNYRDMSKELFKGCVASEISLYDAIARRILPMPKYIVAIYDFAEKIKELESEIDNSNNTEIEKSILKQKIKVLEDRNNSSKYIENILSKHITNEKNFIVFCKNVEHINIMIPIVKEWFSNVFSNIPINHYELCYKHRNPQRELTRYLDNIESDTYSFNLLFTVDMLNEGIHAKKIDGVILLRPTISPNIYYQQIGRAMNAISTKSPIIFDFVNNSETIQADTLFNSIKESLRRGPVETPRDYNDEVKYIVNQIYDETEDTLNLFKEIENSLRSTWDDMYEKLERYHGIHGNIVLQKSKDKKLYEWMIYCRYKRARNELTVERINKLDKLGFIWDSDDARWEEKYETLKNFKNTFGHINVSKEYSCALFRWIERQRTAKGRDELSEYRIKKLEDLGMIWILKDHQWNLNYSEVLEIYKSLGHLEISYMSSYINSKGELIKITPKLKKWYAHQKELIRTNKIKPDRLEKLKKLGICEHLEVRNNDEIWKNNIEKLLKYKVVYGNTNVPRDYEDEELRYFVDRVRKTYCRISEKRKAELSNLGFIASESEAEWEIKFDLFKKALEENNFSYDFLNKGEFKSLKTWVKTQRNSYKEGRLSQYKTDKLNSLNFIWNMDIYKWEIKFKELKTFKDKFNKFPTEKENSKLYKWLIEQKSLYIKGTLKSERFAKLEELGYKFK